MHERILEIESSPNELDFLVNDFTKIVEKYAPYCIVSGYVSIFLGVERPTQDVDIVVAEMKKDSFEKMLDEFEKAGMQVPTAPREMLYDVFNKEKTLSVFTKTQWYFDFKKARTKWEILDIKYPLKVRKGKIELNIAPPEIQIPYKIRLGSDKDIKDASFLYYKLKNIINEKEMNEIAKELKVDLSLLGI